MAAVIIMNTVIPMYKTHVLQYLSGRGVDWGVGKKSEMQESLKPNMKELAWTITAALIARFTNKLITFRF